MMRNIDVIVTEKMIDAGIGEFLEYGNGGMSTGQMVRNIFVAMLLASSLCPEVLLAIRRGQHDGYDADKSLSIG